jgi:glycosyltransferase involved in cell wall biosynthesis
MAKKTLIIIPAYNEEKTLGKVIRGIKRGADAKILVVNDGSQDKTENVARKNRADVISLPFNLGIGGSVQTGLKYAFLNDFDATVQVDADGQHDPKYIPKLLKALGSKTDMVIGSRYKQKTNYPSSFLRKLGNQIFSYLIEVTCGQKIHDTTSGYRVYGKRAICLFAKTYPIDFPEPESIVKLLKKGYRIKEVPVEMKKRGGGTSSVTPTKAIYLIISISIAILVQAFKNVKNE